jgi:hypothetical protein
MRKITKQAVQHFLDGKCFNSGNTLVIAKTYNTFLFLHGHLIAQIGDNGLEITNAGWFSNVTKERLNGLPNVSIYQRNFKWYLNGKEWDGKMTKINNN